jgi:hypothetical protein
LTSSGTAAEEGGKTVPLVRAGEGCLQDPRRGLEREGGPELTDPEQDALRRRVEALEQRVRALEQAEAYLDIRLTTHRAIVTQIALMELAKITGLTQEDCEEALDGFAAHIEALREADETVEAKRQFEMILSEVKAFRNHWEDRPSPVLRLIRGGKGGALMECGSASVGQWQKRLNFGSAGMFNRRPRAYPDTPRSRSGAS